MMKSVQNYSSFKHHTKIWNRPWVCLLCVS